MFDVTSRSSYENVNSWYKEIVRVCGENIPIVLCGNKVDIQDEKRVVKTEEVTFHLDKENMHYYDISAKSNFNFEEPFLWLTRKLFDDTTLDFVQYSCHCPIPDILLDATQMRQIEEELLKAQSMPLPDDDEDL